MDAPALERLVGRENVPRVVAALTTIVESSFDVCPVRHLTRSAVKERVDICMRLLSRLKGELRWSLPKTLDHLAEYLVYELNGVSYTPTTATRWVPRTPSGLLLPR